MAAAAFSFVLPPELNAPAPPERRGLRRDHVRLLVLDRATGAASHSRFDRLGDFLRPGDLLILNNSRTLPAVLPTSGPAGEPVEIRLAHRLGPDTWRALLVGRAQSGDQLRLREGLTARIEYASEAEPLAIIRFSCSGAALYDALYRIGQPVRYEYIDQPWALDYYQTVFAAVPGSVEMPSAGRAFTWELLLGLRRRGIGAAFLSLHAGLSYFLDDRWVKDPRYTPEEYAIPAATADAIARTKQAGGRVIAVGTTVVRALETAALSGQLAGWASLFIDRTFPLQWVDGLLTGLHEPEATHLDLLSAFMAPELLCSAYQGAIDQGYLWHEFGDANLIL